MQCPYMVPLSLQIVGVSELYEYEVEWGPALALARVQRDARSPALGFHVF